MKILLAAFYPVFSNAAGAEKIFWEMANEFSRRNFEVIAVGFQNKNGRSFFHIDEKIKCYNAGKNIKSIKIKLKSLIYITKTARHEFINRCELMKKVQNLQDILNKEKPDIIISFQPKMTYAILEIINSNIPVITMFHNVPGAPDVPLNNELWNQALKRSKRIQVLMPDYVEMLKRNLNYKNVIYIPNPVPKIVSKYKTKKQKIICVGRVEPNAKRQHLLIEAFNKVKNHFLNWEIEFYGTLADKEYLKFCKNLIAKYGLEKNIHFYGVTNDIYSKLNECEFFAFPSAYEGMPLALTEAMAAGLPAIGYKSCPGVNELIIDGYNGFLCEDGIDDFAEKLKILMQDAELCKKMGQNARESMKQFAPEKIWDEWEDLINKVVE